jgi:small lipoprotein (TIGR04454 family)
MRWLMFVALIGCGSKDDGPSCDKVVDNMLVITKSAMPAGHDGMEMNNRKQMVEQCVKRNMSAAERRCLAAAKDVAGMAACTPKKP